MARRPVLSFKKKEAAVARFEQVVRDGYSDLTLPDKLRDHARYIDQHRGEEFGGTLKFELLAAIERLASEDKGLGVVRLQMRDTLCHVLRSVGPVPKKERDAQDWAAEVAGILQPRYTKAATFTARVSLFLKIMKVIEDYPLAFKGYLTVLPIITSRVKESRKRRQGTMEKPKSRSPYSITELRDTLNLMDFAEVLLTLVYLQYGFRAKEAERLTERSIRAGKLLLNSVTSKVVTDKAPDLFLLTQAALSYCGGTFVGISLLDKIERQRLRLTAAVFMTLSGHDLLSITHRTGHANLRMLVNHYAKFLPADYKMGHSFDDYVGLGNLLINGQRVLESSYDQWLLQTALEFAVKSSNQDFVDIVKQLNSGAQSDKKPRKVVSF